MYEPCQDIFDYQVDELLWLEKVKDKLPAMYQQRFGQLIDYFQVEIPHRFESAVFWDDVTKKKVKEKCAEVTEKLYELRGQAKVHKGNYYAPRAGLPEVEKDLREIESYVVADLLDQVADCVCPKD